MGGVVLLPPLRRLIKKMKKKTLVLIFLLLVLANFVQAQGGGLLTLPTVSVGVIFFRLANILFYLLISLAFLFVLWGGISFVTAGGDPNKIETAKRIITFALIGIGVGAVAFGITNLIYSYLSRSP